MFGVLSQNYQHFLKSNACILKSKLSKELKNGIKTLVGQAIFKVIYQNSQNIVLINNLRTTWPT